jgi:CRP/FNR family transcriptional regulator, nitrogen fixation regulation protein
MLVCIADKYSVTGGRVDDGGAEMNSNRAGLHVSEPVWTHERFASPRSRPEPLESLATTLSRYQRDEEIYPQQGSVECWCRVVSGAARRYTLRADGRRQIVDLLLPDDFFGFGVGGTHAFTADAIAADTIIRRYPVSRIETLVTADPRAAREVNGVISGAMSRLHSLLLIMGRTTAEQKVGAFLLYMHERLGNSRANRVALPVSRYDVADYLALSVETVSRSLTGLKERGLIALSGPREIAILDRYALADEQDAGEMAASPQAVERCVSSAIPELPRTQSVEVRVPPFAFGNVLNDMRRWLDHRRCDPSRFTCVRGGSGAVVVRLEFTKGNETVAQAFEERFAAPNASAVGLTSCSSSDFRSS